MILAGIVAQYHGTCADCDYPITPGDRIHSINGEWRHVRCGTPAETAACVCERCWLVHNGECM